MSNGRRHVAGDESKRSLNDGLLSLRNAERWLNLRRCHMGERADQLKAFASVLIAARHASCVTSRPSQLHVSPSSRRISRTMATLGLEKPQTYDIEEECVLSDTRCDDQLPPKNVFGEMAALARKLGEDGVDLGQGFPDFDPPDFVVEALRKELVAGTEGEVRITHQYTRTAGFPPLAEVLASRYSKHLGRYIDPMSEVAITVGCTNALFLSLQMVLAKAAVGCNEVVVLEPFFGLYRDQTVGLNGKLRSVPLHFNATARSFSLDIEALRSAIGPQTAAIIVNTPQNPTGKAFEYEELEAIADIVRANPHVVVISDEVYKFMVFDPPQNYYQVVLEDYAEKPAGHFHFATFPDMWSRTITVSSAGKTFGITGWQIGWATGPDEFIGPIQKYMSNLQFCAPTLMQRALTQVFKQADEPFRGHISYYEWLRDDYSMRRQRMVSALEGAGIPTVRSQGGFFLLADISGLCGPNGPLGDVWAEESQPGEAQDWTFCRAMAKKLGVVALPMSPFFSDDTPADVRTRFVRFCFAKTDSTLEEAAKRLQMLKAASI